MFIIISSNCIGFIYLETAQKVNQKTESAVHFFNTHEAYTCMLNKQNHRSYFRVITLETKIQLSFKCYNSTSEVP